MQSHSGSQAPRVAPCPPCSVVSSRKPPLRARALRVHGEQQSCKARTVFPADHAVAAGAADVSHRVQACRHEALFARPGPHVGHGAEEVRLAVATVKRLRAKAEASGTCLARCAQWPDSGNATPARVERDARGAEKRALVWQRRPARRGAAPWKQARPSWRGACGSAGSGMCAPQAPPQSGAPCPRRCVKGRARLVSATRPPGQGRRFAGGVRAKPPAQGRRSGRETRSPASLAAFWEGHAGCRAWSNDERTEKARCTGCDTRQHALLGGQLCIY